MAVNFNDHISSLVSANSNADQRAERAARTGVDFSGRIVSKRRRQSEFSAVAFNNPTNYKGPSSTVNGRMAFINSSEQISSSAPAFNSQV